MDDWNRIEKIDDFQGRPLKPPEAVFEMPHSEFTPRVVIEHRGSPRRPLIARILLSDEEKIITGVCRDISIGGMQVLTSKDSRTTGIDDPIERNSVSPPGAFFSTRGDRAYSGGQSWIQLQV